LSLTEHTGAAEKMNIERPTSNIEWEKMEPKNNIMIFKEEI